MKERERYPNLYLFGFRQNTVQVKRFGWRVWLMTIVGAIVVGVIGAEMHLAWGIDLFGWHEIFWVGPFVLAILLLNERFFRPKEDAASVAQRKIQPFERMLPRIIKLHLRKGQLEILLGEALASRLENLAKGARDANVALVQISTLGPDLSKYYKETIAETIRALDACFRRAAVALMNPLVYRTSMQEDGLAAFAAEEARMSELAQESHAFRASLLKPSQPEDTSLIVERLRALQEVEKTLAAEDEAPGWRRIQMFGVSDASPEGASTP